MQEQTGLKIPNNWLTALPLSTKAELMSHDSRFTKQGRGVGESGTVGGR
jgi:hypothetical protein